MHQSTVEQAQERVDELRQKLREEVTTEVRGNLRRRQWRAAVFRCLGCCGLYGLALLIIPALLVVFIARTGIVHVPVLTDWMAHERAPSRVVAPSNIPFAELMREPMRAFGRAARAGSSESATFTLTESQLTTLLRTALQQSGRGGVLAVIAPTAQVAVLADSIELYARMPTVAGGTTSIRVRGIPIIHETSFDVDFREVAIGNVGLPLALVRPIMRELLKRTSPLVVSGDVRSSGFSIERVTYTEGSVVVDVRLVR